METKENNNIEIIEEPKELNGIEETIQTMLEKVMEEKDDQSSFDFDDDEIEDESFKISRHSTRHQTTAKPNIIRHQFPHLIIQCLIQTFIWEILL